MLFKGEFYSCISLNVCLLRRPHAGGSQSFWSEGNDVNLCSMVGRDLTYVVIASVLGGGMTSASCCSHFRDLRLRKVLIAEEAATARALLKFGMFAQAVYALIVFVPHLLQLAQVNVFSTMHKFVYCTVQLLCSGSATLSA